MTNPESTNWDPDGYVLTVTKGQTSHSKTPGYRNSYFFAENEFGLISDTNSLLLSILFAKNLVRYQRDPYWKKYHIDYLNSLVKQFIEEFDSEMLEIFLEGRLKMINLLDTPGGLEPVTTLGAADEIRSSGGFVEAYVTREASSAGAMVFEAAQNRLALPDSKLLWHLGSFRLPEADDVSTDSTMFSLTEDGQMDRMRAFFRKSVKEEYWPIVEARICAAENNPENIYNQFSFTGAELCEFGVVTRTFPDELTMLEHFRDSLSTFTEEDIMRFKEFFLGSDIRFLDDDAYFDELLMKTSRNTST